MNTIISDTKQALGEAAAQRGTDHIRQVLRKEGEATIILATGASQYEMLEHLVRAEDIDWQKVEVFHLDEYIGMTSDHPASFRRYLKERFVDQLPGPIGGFHYINAEQDPNAECERLTQLISKATIDVAFVGIGENGHLAFNDPPADFETEEPYIVVRLDEACRQQQMGEGWFDSLEEVPEKAISMSVQQILNAKAIICSVPDRRKATAVAHALEGPVTPDVPASILQTHANCHLFLDTLSASKLKERSTYSS